FDVLGLTAGCTEDDIRAAYRRLAMKHHPDRGGDEKAFVKIQAAYEQAFALAGGIADRPPARTEPVLRVLWPEEGGPWEQRFTAHCRKRQRFFNMRELRISG